MSGRLGLRQLTGTGTGWEMGLSRLSVSLCTALYSLISLSRLWLSLLLLLLLLLLFFFKIYIGSGLVDWDQWDGSESKSFFCFFGKFTTNFFFFGAQAS